MSPFRLLPWLLPALLYAGFWIWYTPLGGPLTDAEIDTVLDTLVERGAEPARIDRFRRFFAADDGGQFVMINVLDAAEAPPALPATGPGATADELMSHYMEHMYGNLLRRACHPLFMGTALGESLDLAGISGAEAWSQAALMRYRSRRDLLEIIADPATHQRHEYKLAALEKTIAFPVQPRLFLSDLRLLLALALLALAGVVDALVRRW